jgi:ferredoxin
MKTKKIVLHFPASLVNKPIVQNLIRDYNLNFNILKAQILPDEEGLMVLELSGRDKDYDSGIKYLKAAGVRIQPLSKDIKRDEDKCTHCGACIVMCPTQALRVDEKSREIIFESEKCIGCELCIDPCPTRAMILHF